ncbi:alpha-L-fucosidase 2 [Microbacterium halimionae]|uniref:Alpha-L-fucosidase 2 n=1 Tax=Microbacterium halimionae TaxID=1526413 RepID=A0A7W3JQL4_9MICO|nr:glycoside hydrolase N-terminal domain-containing protein [Microbacterium halimionae]MBA8817171.1 alpha-L-fucosidase 2 [Microbacterium halimionae]NII94621.1 alpha-L-fucosidase 2 [Microbacterium halimionae]
MSSLIYRGAARDWTERLPLGDGSFGAMCQGATPHARFALNHDTVWSGEWPQASAGPDEAEARDALALARDYLSNGRIQAAEQQLRRLQSGHSQAYLPFAELEIRRDGRSTLLPERTLDLVDGVHEVSDAGVCETTFVYQGVLVHRVRGARVTGLNLTTQLWVIGNAHTSDERHLLVRLPVDVAPRHEPASPPARWGDGTERVVEGAVVARILPADATGQTVLVAGATTFDRIGHAPVGSASDALRRARTLIDAAAQQGPDGLERAHRDSHRAVMQRVQLVTSLERERDVRSTDERVRLAAESGDPLAADPALAALLFDYGRYLLWSSSRPGSLPATLQGIWNENMQPPWSSNYTVNINTEMNYWGAYVAALPETAMPFADLVVALSERGTETARRLYGAPGWVCHHNTDAWAFTEIAGAGNGDACWAFWPMGGPWLIQQLWEAVDFGAASTSDVEAWWPAIRGATEFGLAWLRRDENGEWVTSPATSPENTYRRPSGGVAGVDVTSALDLQLLRTLFRITAAAADRLGIGNDPVVATARARAAELPETPRVGSDGLPIEWANEYRADDIHHRHVSPLFWQYPGGGVGTDADRDAARALLLSRGDGSAGWSVVWKAVLWARLHRADKVTDILRHLFRPSHEMDGPYGGGLCSNLLASHPPFQIDGNLGYIAALAETLVQSHDGIELLPALPPALSDGEARGLIARPGIVVSMRWRGGQLVEASLRSLGETRTVRVKWGTFELTCTIERRNAITLLPRDFISAAPNQ